MTRLSQLAMLLPVLINTLCDAHENETKGPWKGYAILGNVHLTAVYSDDSRIDERRRTPHKISNALPYRMKAIAAPCRHCQGAAPNSPPPCCSGAVCRIINCLHTNPNAATIAYMQGKL